MKTLFQTLVYLITTVLFLNPLYAEESSTETDSSFSYGIDADFVSRYVWRGIAYSEGAVWQPSAYVEAYGFGFCVWSNFVLTDEADQGQFNEIDYTFYYSHDVTDTLHTQFSAIIYSYPATEASPTTVELIPEIAYTVGPIDLVTTVSVDVAEYDGATFWRIGPSFSRELSSSLGIETSLVFGMGNGKFNETYLADVGTKANLLEFNLALPWTVWKGLTATPHLQVSTLLAGDLRDAAPDPTIISGGLNVGYGF